MPAANTILKYQAKASIQIHTGDAGAMAVSINGILQPPIGEAHAIADKTYTLATINAASTAVTPNPQNAPTSGPVVATDAVMGTTATLFVASKP